MSALPLTRPMNTKYSPLRILVADDHALIRGGLTQLLTQWDPAVVVTEAADGLQLEALLDAELHWDLVLVDLVMPKFNGVTAVEALVARFTGVPFIVVSGSDDATTMRQLLVAGVAGFLPKDTDGGLILKAIELVLAGGRYIPPLALPPSDPARTSDAGTSAGTASTDITARQQEILELLRRGLPNKVIAGNLGISEATVKMHMTSLLRRFNVRSRAELIVLLK